jgi:hypothetical protein
LQNRITEKFQSLVVLVISLLFVGETRMRQCLLKQSLIVKMVAEALLERFHVNVFEKPPAR